MQSMCQHFQKKNNHFLLQRFYSQLFKNREVQMSTPQFKISSTTILFLILLLFVGQSATAVDLYQPHSTEQFSCMRSNNISYAIFRALRSNGLLDTNATKNIERAVAAGLATDIYIFVCRRKNATEQVKKVIRNLRNVTKLYSTIWIDVEVIHNVNCGWNFADKSTNCEYLRQIMKAVEKQGKKVGIYTSIVNWKNIFGDTNACPQAASAPLWYAHYKENHKVRATFLDFKAFGGWKTPTMKQYAQNQNICNANVDLSFKQ